MTVLVVQRIEFQSIDKNNFSLCQGVFISPQRRQHLIISKTIDIVASILFGIKNWKKMVTSSISIIYNDKYNIIDCFCC